MEQNPDNYGLTHFQKKCEQRLRSCLEGLGIEFQRREIRWIGEPAIRAEIQSFNIWIYVDEAEIGGTGVEWHYEKYDYDTPDQLIEAFVSRVTRLIQKETDR
jgi:G:T-mismatch repair DNA endonuclease (very short patch repair protein)